MPRILIVDDLKENIDLVSDTLTIGQPDVLTLQAQGGIQALNLIEKYGTTIDLIILDANMPDLDGFTVCQRIKKNPDTQNLPILMLSGIHITNLDRSKGLNSGADSYLCKPYHPQELLAQVSVLLRLKKANDQLQNLNQPQNPSQNQPPETRSAISFKALFNAAPDAIFVENKDGIVLDANPQACHLQNLTKQKLLGRSIFDLVPEKAQNDARQLFSAWFNGSQNKIQSEILQPNGTTLPIEITGRPVEYHGQEAILIQIRDISIRHALEQQIRTAQKMDAVGRLARGVAHDFNNLLTTILGYSHIILDTESLNEEQQNDLLQVTNAANRAADLTRQLMVFGRRQLQPLHPVNINTTLRDIDPLMRRTLDSHIEIVTLLAENLATIHSDESHIEHIIINLSLNAMDAMPHGGQLTLQTYNQTLKQRPQSAPPTQPLGDYAILEISDTGNGIPEAQLEHIIEPFYTTKTPGQGVGLGLSTVFGMIQHGNGFMEIQSNPGKGTNIRIFFPATNDPIPAKKKPDDQTPQGGTETLLIVDDEPLLRHLTQRQLTELGYTVLSAANGSEALRRIEEHPHPIDMIITDIIMPQMGGPEMITRIQEKRRPKILFISGYGDNEFTLGNMLDGPHQLLRKPFTKHALAQRIRETLNAN